jgi:exodeoxyribonuclease VII large subunit
VRNINNHRNRNLVQMPSHFRDSDEHTDDDVGGFDGSSADDARSVSELIADINLVLAREFRDVWVYGEVGKVTNAASGHCYFDLIEEEDGARSVLAIKLFRGVRQSLASKMKQHGVDIVSGIKVRIRVTPDVFAQNGSLGFKMSDLDPRFTLGDLAAKREEIIVRLKRDGLYDRNKRTHLPLVPLGIGLVTSKGSAAHADFMKTLEQSGIGFRVSLCDVRVQGDGAAASVAAAVEHLATLEDIELVAVIRGGGSKTDLAAFDDEALARVVATCAKPVFTGIGHEVDTSIVDEVAYSWNKTPTACAVAIIDVVNEFVVRVESAAQRMANIVLHALAAAERRVADAVGQLRTLRTTVLNGAKSRVDLLESELKGFDPVVLMRRGWSITYGADGRVIRSTKQATKGAELSTRLADGTVLSTVSGTVSGTRSNAADEKR